MRTRFAVLFSATVFMLIAGSAHAAEGPVVFAAASLRNAMEQIGRSYEARYAVRPVFSFAASSTLARQIDAGAPADVYVSANVQWMDWAQDRGVIVEDQRRIVAGNGLVVVGPNSDAQKLALEDPSAVSMRLGEGRLAMGDPDHVPAGRYGRMALEAMGLWSIFEGRLARGENVRVALALVARGEAPLGIVYSSDAAVEPSVAIVATFPEDSHPVIAYPAAPLRDAPHRAEAERFVTYLLSSDAQSALVQAGLRPAPADQ